MVGVVGQLPRGDREVDLDEITVQVGGHAAIAARAAHALGCRARLATRLADDFLSDFLLGALKETGIEVKCVRDASRQLSPFRFSALAEHTGEVARFVTAGDAGQLTAKDIATLDLLDGVDALLIDGSSPAAQLELARSASHRQIPVIFDGSRMHDAIGALVATSDIFICSERLATELALVDSLDAALVDIQKMGPRAVIITLAEKGAVGLHRDQLVEVPALPVEEIDVAGAGAVYHGTFAAALLSDLPFSKCMEWASVAASLSCRRLGAFVGVPERDEISEHLKSFG
jgi:sugar/nucleoside kinase (ribokinase family)